MKRRALLASLGTVSVGLAAGCVADDGDGGDGGADGSDGSDGGDGDGSDTPTDGSDGADDSTPSGDAPPEDDVRPELVDASIETVETGCAGRDDDTVDVTFGSDGVVIEGVAPASNPCHEATLESTTVEGGELHVVIGLDSSAEACVECVGAIEYTVRADLEGVDGLDTVVVDNGDMGGTHSVSRTSEGTESGGVEGDDPEPHEDTPTDTPGDRPTDTPGHASNEPDPDLPIVVENRDGEAHAVDVVVVRDSGETVHDETHELAAESNRRVYNLRDADPDGIEQFHVRTATGDQSDGVSVKTDECHGRVVISVSPEGDLDATYSVC